MLTKVLILLTNVSDSTKYHIQFVGNFIPQQFLGIQPIHQGEAQYNMFWHDHENIPWTIRKLRQTKENVRQSINHSHTCLRQVGHLIMKHKIGLSCKTNVDPYSYEIGTNL